MLSQCIDGGVNRSPCWAEAKQVKFPIQLWPGSPISPSSPIPGVSAPRELSCPRCCSNKLSDCFSICFLLFGNRLADCFGPLPQTVLFSFPEICFRSVFSRAGRCDFCVNLILVKPEFFYCFNFFLTAASRRLYQTIRRTPPVPSWILKISLRGMTVWMPTASEKSAITSCSEVVTCSPFDYGAAEGGCTFPTLSTMCCPSWNAKVIS